MPTFRNQVPVKYRLRFAEWDNQSWGRINSPSGVKDQGFWTKYYTERSYLGIKFTDVFFFNKLTYKSPSYASTTGIPLPFIYSAKLTVNGNVSLVGTLLQESVRESQPACVEYSLSSE